MAKWSPVPVINMQCDLYHPLQGLADLMTIIEKFGDTKGVNVSIIWAYATSHKKPISVPLSQALLFPRYGMNTTLAYPAGYELPQWVYDEAEENAKRHGGSFRITHDQNEAYKDADVVIPKNWGNWVTDAKGDTTSKNVLDESLKVWKCTEALMQTVSPRCVYMHALPADRNNEVEDAVIDGKWSVVYDEAENRLHTSKAVMALTMGGRNAYKQ
jgi:ornithine carbamoyltransferase